MNQSSSPIFSCGVELANVVVASDLLTSSWDAISELSKETNVPNELQASSFSVKFKTCQRSKYVIIAFAASKQQQQQLQEEDGGLTPLSELKEICPHFDFLCTKSNPSFSIHKTAATLFSSLHSKLADLKTQVLSEKHTALVITGHSLGGSIAALFTLWLVEDINLSASKRPICITFGSPLLGDNGLRQAISERVTWNSCFLHVACDKDPVPKLSASNTSNAYKPFGTYLLCSESGSACFEEPESILELLRGIDLESRLSDASLHCDLNSPNVNYGQIVEKLKHQVVYRGIAELGERITDPLRAGVMVQLRTIGIKRVQQNSIDVERLVNRAEDAVTQKRRVIDPVKKLNDSKINMAKLEWYKMDSKAKGIGYYDTYKRLLSRQDMEVVKYKRILTNYWKEEVAKAEKRPQKEGAFFRTGWLGGGTTCRRMVEPLDIADYYRERGAKDYINEGRSQHFILLEKWQQENRARAGAGGASATNHDHRKACSLTEDSCFWAHVEEAMLSCKLLRSKAGSPEEETAARASLIEFDKYIMDSIENYAVSPEIFLEQSSFMQWWKDYEKLVGNDRSEPLTVYMKERRYEQYD